MNLIQNDFPWIHYEIENFCNDKTFSQLKKLAFTAEKKGYFGDTYTIQYDIKKTYKPIYNYILEKFKLVLKNLNLNLFLNDIIEIKYNISPPYHNKEEIHTDIEEKKYTGILYISDKGDGTELYSDYYEKGGKYTVPNKILKWIPNKLIFFERTDYSWHCYRNTNSVNRICLNINVYKEEYAN